MARFSCGLAILAAAASVQAQPATFMTFGQNSQASGVSADGTVVAGWLPGPGSNRTAFRWTSGGGFQNLGLGVGPSVFISTDGSTLAWGDSANVLRWTTGTGTQVALPGGISALSGDGLTVVGGTRKWSASQGTTVLQNLNGAGSGLITSNALSYNGSLAFGSYDRNMNPAQLYPTVWNAAGQATSLGASFGQLSNATAVACSDDGSVVYGFGESSGLRLFRWTAATGVVYQPGTNLFQVIDTTGDGRIAVGTTAIVATVWTPQHGAQELGTLLADEFGLDTSAYSLDFATGISNDGRTLVGYGNDQTTGNRVGWKVTLPYEVPTPASAAGLLIGGFWAFCRRR